MLCRITLLAVILPLGFCALAETARGQAYGGYGPGWYPSWPDRPPQVRPWGYGEDDPSFVVGLYQNILGRQPARWEVQTWLDRLAQLRGNRARVAEEFRRDAQFELRQRAAWPPPQPAPWPR
jgi:Domain of unknown function (DUF4214)